MSRSNLYFESAILGLVGLVLLFNFTGEFEEGATYRITTWRRSTGEMVSSNIREGSDVLRTHRIMGLLMVGGAVAVFYHARRKDT